MNQKTRYHRRREQIMADPEKFYEQYKGSVCCVCNSPLTLDTWSKSRMAIGTKICKTCCCKYAHKYNAEHRVEHIEYDHRHKRCLKIKAFKMVAEYHNKSPEQCWKCGETEHGGHPFIDYGQIDHVNGNIKRERIKYSQIVSDIIKVKDLQLLCPTCNWIKRFENKEYG